MTNIQQHLMYSMQQVEPIIPDWIKAWWKPHSEEIIKETATRALLIVFFLSNLLAMQFSASTYSNTVQTPFTFWYISAQIILSGMFYLIWRGYVSLVALALVLLPTIGSIYMLYFSLKVASSAGIAMDTLAIFFALATASLVLKPYYTFVIGAILTTFLSLIILYHPVTAAPDIQKGIEATLVWLPIYTILTSLLLFFLRWLYENAAVQAKANAAAAERANAAKSDFLARMSHDFKTPLHTIIGQTSTIIDLTPDAVNEDAMQRIQRINRAGEQLLMLIGDLMDIYKIEHNELQLNPTAVDLARLVARIDALTQAKLESKPGVLWEIETVGLSTIYAEASKLERILNNLIDNAIRHTCSGSIRLVVTVEDNTTSFVIQDTGEGIADTSHIFERFKSGSRGRSGLGLAIAKDFVDLHNGTIKCDTIVGAGTTFTVRIPTRANDSRLF